MAKRKQIRLDQQPAITVEPGSGNVFADIGLPNPEERLAKAELAYRISRLIEAKELSQAATAKLLKVDQPKISRLLRGRLSGFSTERLMHFLTLLGRDIDIVIRHRSRKRPHGRLRVVALAR
jgi:predicted XRE-type DNA-binding protein